MKCPACTRPLTEFTVDDLEVDACKGGCGGVWFDNHELTKVDEAHEHHGEPLLDLPFDPNIRVDPEARRSCPRCDQIMMRHFFSVKERVEVDRCPACNGTWLDLGELRGLRTTFPTEAQRKAAAAEHFDQLFGDDLAKMRQESEAKLEQARGVAQLFRFLTPSWYIPGKQAGGAF